MTKKEKPAHVAAAKAAAHFAKTAAEYADAAQRADTVAHSEYCEYVAMSAAKFAEIRALASVTRAVEYAAQYAAQVDKYARTATKYAKACAKYSANFDKYVADLTASRAKADGNLKPLETGGELGFSGNHN